MLSLLFVFLIISFGTFLLFGLGLAVTSEKVLTKLLLPCFSLARSSFKILFLSCNSVLSCLREEGAGEGYFLLFREIFLMKYIQIYKKVAQNHLCWSNYRDFISCAGQNTCKKDIYSVSILRNGFRSMCTGLFLVTKYINLFCNITQKLILFFQLLISHKSLFIY